MRDSDLVLPENCHKTERCQKDLESESIISTNSYVLNTRGFSLPFRASSFVFVKSAWPNLPDIITCHFN